MTTYTELEVRIIKTGRESVYVTVPLEDRFDHPIEGHSGWHRLVQFKLRGLVIGGPVGMALRRYVDLVPTNRVMLKLLHGKIVGLTPLYYEEWPSPDTHSR